MKLYVGNLPYSIADQDLLESFGAFGEVVSANVIMDRETGRSKGFGFVEMANATDGQAAVTGMNERELKGRKLRVNEAKPREDRPQQRRPRSY